MTLRAVSFDATGTLLHTARPVGELYATIAAHHGVAMAPLAIEQRFRRAFGNAPPLAFPAAASHEIRAREKAWWRALVTHVFVDVPFRRFDAYFEDLFDFFASPAAWRLDSDAMGVLHAVRARGLTTLVVSNFDARLRGLLHALRLAPLLDAVTISSEAGAAKPDPRIFTRALAPFGLSPAEVAHVGDSVREDLAGGRAAGLRVILVGTAKLLAEVPDATVVTRLGEVPQLLV